ncbi:EpsG family protein [Elizabethkingia anophelis]|nr:MULTISPECIES: EpsG family protein [Elizabethkingia]KUF46338.1 hypothetical protein AS358_00290 [Elizabethkingia anophelis]MCL1691707.1 EpsG family protein [Elizabethkingia anophelis]MCT3643479.1 EpsG family protein [Elizabethkingia anophelis]MCT3650269.1 EpsG family protein [Elizabethkingia anophelis]MCT3653886.1 EpsG family protein [Elizabethkingia anophelis]
MDINFQLILIYLLYYLLCLVNKFKPLFILIAFFFVFFTLYFRFEVPYKYNADYWGYYMLAKEKFEFSFMKIFSEPYFPIIYDFFSSLFGDFFKSLHAVYLFNYIICTIFFIWIAIKKDILFIFKIICFVLYYFLFTYTVVRNSIAYLLITIMLYKLLRNHKFLMGYFSFLFHASSLPIIAATFLKFKKPTPKILLYIIIGVGIFGALLNTAVFFHVINKFDAYSGGGTIAINLTFHRLYFGGMCMFFLLMYYLDRNAIFNSFFLSLFLLYIILFFINPVMSFRYSVYLVLYLCVYPHKRLKYQSFINFCSLILFVYFIFTFYSTHPLM